MCDPPYGIRTEGVIGGDFHIMQSTLCSKDIKLTVKRRLSHFYVEGTPRDAWEIKYGVHGKHTWFGAEPVERVECYTGLGLGGRQFSSGCGRTNHKPQLCPLT